MLEKALEKSQKIENTVKKDNKKNADKNSILQHESSIDLKKEELLSIKSSKPVVTFNWGALAENGFIQLNDAHNKIAEEYRSIKRPLVVNALGSRKRDIDNANLILVTSSIPGEGKTFTSINLAFSIAAEMDKKVLLIDADVAKPSVSKVLGIKSEKGLIDFLETDSLQLSDIILETEVPGLRIIPAGKSHKLSTELLASDKMVELSKELSERYPDRIIIFDSPPLLATTQAEVLASHMGQVVLVIGAETTPQNFVMQSVTKLQNCSDVVLALLNKAKRKLDGDYYGYGHY